MNFRQYKKIRKELIFYKKLLQERYNKEYYYCDNTSVIILLSKKEVKRITSLQNVFLKKNPYKKFNRIEKYEKEKAKRIIEHQERNKRFYFRGAKNLCVGVIE